MAARDTEESSVCSEETSSVYDEERTRKLFQACDTDGDGYIDGHDLESICQELNLDNCIEGLMQELGADEEGKISFEKFLNCKNALRPEIRVLKKKISSKETDDYVPNGSNNSVSKHDCWEFDSGARDLSPEPSTLQRLIDTAGVSTGTGNLLQLANKLHLAAVQSLRSELSELSTRLQSVTEERDILIGALKKYQDKTDSSSAQRYEERITELHSVIAELNKKLTTQRENIITEEEDVSDSECFNTSSTAIIDQEETKIIEKIPKNERHELEELQLKFDELKEQTDKKDDELKHTKLLLGSSYDQMAKMKTKLREAENKKVTSGNSPEARKKNNENSQMQSEAPAPQSKLAERVRLPKLDRSGADSNISSLGVLHTDVAEHVVPNLQNLCNVQELCNQDTKYLEIEIERFRAKVEHIKAQNYTLRKNMHDTREHCERMYILLGKYESQAIALQICSDNCQKIIGRYESVVSLLEKQCEVKSQASNQEMEKLKADISKLKKENATVSGTVVELESYHVHVPKNRSDPSSDESKKIDLEMAVLMQEIMEVREKNAELRGTIYMLDRERETLEIKITALQSQLQAYAFINDDRKGKVNNKDTKLQEKLKEVAVTLEKVNRNADSRHKQSLELINQLKSTNCALMKTLERCKKRSQLKMRKLEAEMITMMEKHATQVATLKRGNQFLEDLTKERFPGAVKESSSQAA